MSNIQEEWFKMSFDCIFCKIIDGKIVSETIVETDISIVIKDIAPHAPIHLLIIPKKHIVNVKEIAKNELYIVTDMFSIAQELGQKVHGASDFKLIINNGKNAGQHVFHLHMHFLAGKINTF